ncbi:MAG: FAD-dependent oxidoreductase [Proteobacteria bacterium]|nr:FAD-dependent oxidoreductase [Pseudomonadota bacterium]
MTKVIGSVLVLGGGISGIQSALDLANSGYYVYMVEKTPAIGGAMPKFDKTFPTNDCAMCILSPKLVEVNRHPNIELITCADLESVEGTEGNFKVKVRKYARSIDMELCTGCGTCIENCPVTTYPVSGDNEKSGTALKV